MPKKKIRKNRFSKPFILFTTKQKYCFVNNMVASVEIALMQSGKKMSLRNKFVLQTKLLKMVGILKDE